MNIPLYKHQLKALIWSHKNTEKYYAMKKNRSTLKNSVLDRTLTHNLQYPRDVIVEHLENIDTSLAYG